MRKIYSLCLLIVFFINLTYVIITFVPSDKETSINIINPIASTVLAETIKREDFSSDGSEATQDFTEYNILLLGLDGRKGDNKPRCDAIHIFTFTPIDEKLTITSIPRGTMISPNKELSSTYLANSCHINGIEATISEIEKIANLKIDAFVKIGFSQTMGILRALKFPSSPTLQYLRNRRYAIGDNQRSYNQAVFLKDAIVGHFEEYILLPDSIKYWIYKMVDTNLDFDTALYLANKLAKLKIQEKPDKIILESKPERSRYVKEFHFDGDYQANDWQEDSDFKTYQEDMENYLFNLTGQAERYLDTGKLNYAYNLLKIPYEQKLWLQLEDKNKRTEAYYQMMKNYLAVLSDFEEQSNIINNFIEEMKLDDRKDYLEKVEELTAVTEL